MAIKREVNFSLPLQLLFHSVASNVVLEWLRAHCGGVFKSAIATVIPIG
jgi:hypothetical protein